MIRIDGPVLATANLTLRPPRAGDWPDWAAFAASPRAVFIGGPLDTGKAWRAFGHVCGMWILRGFGSFVFTLKGDDRPIGMTGPWYPADWPEREIGWTVWSRDHEGKGLAFEAASAARDHAFRDLRWDTAVSYIDRDNARSIALAERLGATLDPLARRTDPSMVVYRHPRPEGLA